MQVSIPTSALKAAIHCAATKDVRYYLNGVNIEFCHGDVPHINLISTDGHVLSALRVPLVYREGAQTADFSLIVPLSAIVSATKGAGKVITLSSMLDGRYALGDTLVLPIDDRFPDWQRVIPMTTGLTPASATYRPEFLLRGAKCLRDFFNAPKLIPTMLCRGDDGGIMHNGDNSAVVVIMPSKSINLPDYKGFAA